MLPEWDIPKGGVKAGETLRTALFRKLGEVGPVNAFRVVRKLPFSIDFKFPRGSAYSSQHTVLFLVEYKDESFELKPRMREVRQVAAFPISDLDWLVRYRETLAAVRKARKYWK
jgi:ADP-ribose pyrophosphatase YjhB (NUDIX family)